MLERPKNKNLIAVRVLAGSRQNKVTALAPGVYKVWTTVSPEKGKANKKVLKLLASYLGVKIGDLVIVSGETKKQKIIKIN